MTSGNSRCGTGAIGATSAAAGGSGGYKLTSERDIYELIANMGQRRKRAVLLTVIPGDVTEAALEQCGRTMEADADTSEEGIKKLIEAFAALDVTAQQIEARIQRRLSAIRPAQIVQLRKIYNSLRDGMSEADDWFEAEVQPPASTEAPKEPTQPLPRLPSGKAGGGRQHRAACPTTRSSGSCSGAANETAKSDAAAAPPKRRVNFEV